ncbi:MAG: radical SAM family heme chaperone HemW [Atopobiaceae bacterium]|nr:radical SAM family heme chaperone HemW [Atopobiaceae bacterium]
MGVGALYVHVPFCARKCRYCDFASEATRTDDPCMDGYLKERIAELDRCQRLGMLGSCKTAYLGGGTPTFLGATRLGTLVSRIRMTCPNLTEFSCEANPDSLTDEVIEALRGAGVTRVSIGVQSLDDEELRALGRIHTADQARTRVQAAIAAGLDVSVDLMCAIPKQTDESWRQTLREVIALGVGHVSVYPLAIEEGTPFGKRYGDETPPWNDEDVQAQRMECAEHQLTAAGLHRYEVASYARKGKQCAHNIAYWTGIPYLGLGPGAASMLDASCYNGARRLYDWLPPRPHEASRMRFSTLDREVEFLSAREAWAEDLMLGMRLTRGVEEERLDAVPDTRDDLLARGLVERNGGRLIPTHDGWLLGNELFATLWDLHQQC